MSRGVCAPGQRVGGAAGVSASLAVLAVALLLPLLVAPSASARGLCGDAVHAYRMTGQPVNRWLVRITGPDLMRTIGFPARAEADIVIKDGAGRTILNVPFDQHSPLNTQFYAHGPTVEISISVTATPDNGRGCDKYITLNHI